METTQAAPLTLSQFRALMLATGAPKAIATRVTRWVGWEVAPGHYSLASLLEAARDVPYIGATSLRWIYATAERNPTARVFIPL